VAVNCWMEFTGMTRLAGLTDTEARVTEAGVLLLLLHAARDRAKKPRNNISRTDFIFLMSTIPSPETTKLGLSELVHIVAVHNCDQPALPTGLTSGHQLSLQSEITLMARLAAAPSLAAVMVAVPGETPVASPPLLIVATDGLEELQLTWVVISWFPPSEYQPRA